MLGKIEGRRRSGWQRMRWMASPTNGHEFEQAPGVGDGQGSLACFSPWGCKESNTTEWLNWTESSLLGHTTKLVSISDERTKKVPLESEKMPASGLPWELWWGLAFQMKNPQGCIMNESEDCGGGGEGECTSSANYLIKVDIRVKNMCCLYPVHSRMW